MTHHHTHKIHHHQRDQLPQWPPQNIQITLIPLRMLNKLTQHHIRFVTNRAKESSRSNTGSSPVSQSLSDGKDIYLIHIRDTSASFDVLHHCGCFFKLAIASDAVDILVGVGITSCFFFLLLVVYLCGDGELKPVVEISDDGIDDFGLGLMFLKEMS